MALFDPVNPCRKVAIIFLDNIPHTGYEPANRVPTKNITIILCQNHPLSQIKYDGGIFVNLEKSGKLNSINRNANNNAMVLIKTDSKRNCRISCGVVPPKTFRRLISDDLFIELMVSKLTKFIHAIVMINHAMIYRKITEFLFPFVLSSCI